MSGKGTLCQGDNDCCTEDNQCGLGEGDCDSNADCLGELICGTENCAEVYKLLNSQNPDSMAQIDVTKFSGSDDCCFFDDELTEYIKYLSTLEK